VSAARQIRRDELRAVSTDDLSGKIRVMRRRRFTEDPLETFGGAGRRDSQYAKLLHYICENGFEHHVAAILDVAPVIHEATTRYLGWDMYAHA